MRLFFALRPPAETSRALGEWAREVQLVSGGRVTHEEAIHLTLAFLGEADSGKAIAAGRQVKAKGFAFSLDIARYWPHHRIVWVAPRELPAELADLARRLHAALA